MGKNTERLKTFHRILRKLAHVLRFHAIREIGPQKSFTAEGWRVECLYLLQLWDGQAPLAGEVAGGRMGLERLNEWLAPFPGSKELDPLTALARGLNAALRLPPGQAFSRDALEEAFKTESKCTGSSGGGVDEAKLSALVAAKGKTLADLESALFFGVLTDKRLAQLKADTALFRTSAGAAAGRGGAKGRHGRAAAGAPPAPRAPKPARSPPRAETDADQPPPRRQRTARSARPSSSGAEPESASQLEQLLYVASQAQEEPEEPEEAGKAGKAEEAVAGAGGGAGGAGAEAVAAGAPKAEGGRAEPQCAFAMFTMAALASEGEGEAAGAARRALRPAPPPSLRLREAQPAGGWAGWSALGGPERPAANYLGAGLALPRSPTAPAC